MALLRLLPVRVQHQCVDGSLLHLEINFEAIRLSQAQAASALPRRSQHRNPPPNQYPG